MQFPQLPLKPGITTSEFWIVVICSLLLTAQTALSMLTPGWAAGGVIALGLIYTSVRGKLKGIQAQAAADHLKAQSQAAAAGNEAPPST